MPRTCIAVVALLFFTPVWVYGAVQITEVAWMGTSVSADDEWIELHNTGGVSVDMLGWTLTDGGDITFTFSEEIEETTLPAGAYAVLERTDDSSAPVDAFAIYTGSLSNGGETLTLRRPDGTTVDTVAGADRWTQIGGNNTTKETPQRTDTGWFTAASTPGAPAGEAPAPEPPDDEPPKKEDELPDTAPEEEAPARPRAGGTAPRISISLPDNVLSLSIEAPETGHVGQVLGLRAVADGIGERLINSLRYTWSFGDFRGGTGRATTHTYTHPGTYVVMVEATYARHTAVARHQITVLPVSLSLRRTHAGDIVVHNETKHEIDLSGYTLVGDTTLVVPRHTTLLPEAEITIARGKIEEGPHKMIVLYDAGGTPAAASVPGMLPRGERAAYAHAPPTEAAQLPPARSPHAALTASAARAPEETAASPSSPASTPSRPSPLPYIALAGLILVAALSALFVGTRPTTRT